MLNDGDIAFWKARTNNNESDNGGPMVGVKIPSGQMGNVFGPIPSLVRQATGYVFARAVFGGIDTPDSQVYSRVLAFVSRPSTDPNSVVTLLETQDWFDTWSTARDNFEKFLVLGSRWPGRLLETQPSGGKTIQIFQPVGGELPAVGSVLALVANPGLPTQFEQFVVVTKVSVATRQFSIWTGGAEVFFTRDVLTVEIADKMETDFVGEPPAIQVLPNPSAVVVTTTAANAASFKGIMQLTAAVEAGESEAFVDGVFAQIVPPLRSESAIPSTHPLRGAVAALAVSGSNLVTVAFSTAALGPGDSVYLGTPCVRGTFSLVIGGATLLATGAGVVMSGSVPVGTFDHAAGHMVLSAGSPTYSGAAGATFQPAAAPSVNVFSTSFGVAVGAQGTVYSLELDPPPPPGALMVEYRTAGKWYRLEDGGNGVLAGSDPAYGSGTYTVSTGQATATLGALPDIGSEVVFYWAVPNLTVKRSDQTILPPAAVLQCAHPGGHPGSFVVTWNDGIADRTATDNGHGGFTDDSDATGQIVYADSKLWVRPKVLPPPGTQYHVAYHTGEKKTFVATNPMTWGGVANITLPEGDILPGSVDVSYALVWDQAFVSGGRTSGMMHGQDNGSGGFDDLPGSTANYLGGTLEIHTVRQVGNHKVSYTMTEGGLWTPGQSIAFGF